MKNYAFSSKHLAVVEEAMPETLFTDIENTIYSKLQEYGKTSDILTLLTLLENEHDAHPEFAPALLKSLIIIKDEHLRAQICSFLITTNERFSSFVHFFITLNNFLEVMVADLYEDGAKRLAFQKIENSQYYDVLYPIISQEDKYISYIFLTEFGAFLLPYLLQGLDKYPPQLFDLISYFVDTITLEYEDRLLTELYQYLLNNIIVYIAAHRFVSREFAEAHSILTEYIVDLMNSKIWLFFFQLDPKYMDANKRYKLSEVVADKQLSRIISELFLSAMQIFHNKYFTHHAHLKWADLYATESEGTIPFLTRMFFLLWNYGAAFPEFYYEELYKLLQIDVLDNLKFRTFLLRNIIYREHGLTFAERGMLRQIYGVESYKIQLLDDDEFIEYLDLTVENSNESVIFFELLDSLEYDDFDF